MKRFSSLLVALAVGSTLWGATFVSAAVQPAGSPTPSTSAAANMKPHWVHRVHHKASQKPQPAQTHERTKPHWTRKSHSKASTVPAH